MAGKCEFCNLEFKRLNTHTNCQAKAFLEKQQEGERRFRLKLLDHSHEVVKLQAQLKEKEKIIQEQRAQIDRLSKLLAEKPTVVFNTFLAGTRHDLNMVASLALSAIRSPPPGLTGLEGAKNLIRYINKGLAESADPVVQRAWRLFSNPQLELQGVSEGVRPALLEEIQHQSEYIKNELTLAVREHVPMTDVEKATFTEAVLGKRARLS